MKPQELTTLALRVLAVFIASQAFEYLAEFATFWTVPPGHRQISFTALSSVWLLGPSIAAIVIWLVAPYLSRLAARGISNEPIPSFDAQSVVSAAFIAAGTFIFVTALPGVAANIARLFGPSAQSFLPDLVASISRCLLALALVVGSRATSRFLLRLRYAGAGVQDV